MIVYSSSFTQLFVIDVIDSHDHFGNQWNARKKFYKKNKILDTENIINGKN